MQLVDQSRMLRLLSEDLRCRMVMKRQEGYTERDQRFERTSRS